MEKNHNLAETITTILIDQVKENTLSNQIAIIKLVNFDKLNITTVINCLAAHFNYNYQTFGASKLPVIAYYVVYLILIQEVDRYRDCLVRNLGSHTASDKTSKTAGDIEIFDKKKQLIEAIEIKQGKAINLQMVLNVKDNILQYHPRRYYIFSSANIQATDELKIQEEIELIARVHGCQVIINGTMPTLKYYLRLIKSVEIFVASYSKLIEKDNKLQAIHKIQWNKILSSIK